MRLGKVQMGLVVLACAWLVAVTAPTASAQNGTMQQVGLVRTGTGAFHIDAEGARARSDQAHLLHGAVLRRGGGGCDRHEPRAGQHNEPHLDLTESHWTYLPSASMEWLPIESVRPP